MNTADQLDELAHGIRTCRLCGLHTTRRNAVPGEGPANASVFMIGEAPGRFEDEQGRPFCGAAGRYLDALLRDFGLDRRAFFITSCVRCRPPRNRKPTDLEIATCTAAWWRRQADLIRPPLFVLLGAVAAKAFVGNAAVGRIHGREFTVDGRRFFVTYHPAAAMRFPAVNAGIRVDFQRLSGLLVNLR